MISRLLPAVVAIAALAGPALADPVDDLVRRYMDASHIPGAAVAVVDDGEIEKLQAYGWADLEQGAAVTSETPFQLASASKIFTGIILMRLSEQGVIRLDDSVTAYLPEAPESWKPVTLRQLASHMSGMPERLGLPSSTTAQEVAAAAMVRPLAYEPGSQSRYGFTDFIVLTAALEKATGLAFPDLLRREITLPLGLTDTGFTFATQTGPAAPSQVQGEALIYDWRDGAQQNDAFLYAPQGYAAGGLYSSARDLAKLFVAIDGGEFLSAESFAALTTAAPLNDGRAGGFAIGWTASTYRGEPVYGHSGGPALADILHVPSQRLTIIALANQRRFFPLLAQSIADTELVPVTPRPTIADARPGLTTAAWTALSAAGAGTLDKQLFSTEGEQSFGFLSDFGKALLTAVGPVQGLDLLSDTPVGDGARRSYRVRFANREMVWVARTDGDGRFAELRPGSETD